jgi:hypothetical protein
VKREEIGSLIRKDLIPWIEKLPESATCLITVTEYGPHRNCARRATYAFTSDHLSYYRGGVYCWTHLMMIVSSGEEQARLEEHLAEASGV